MITVVDRLSKVIVDSFTSKTIVKSDSDSKVIYVNNQPIVVNDSIGGGGLDTRIIKTARYTTTQVIPVTDHAVFCDTDGGAWTATLPAGVDGQEFFITNSGANTLTLDGNGTETINGELTQELSDSDSVHLVFETTEKWRVM